jgi:hypothetical protein
MARDELGEHIEDLMGRPEVEMTPELNDQLSANDEVFYADEEVKSGESSLVPDDQQGGGSKLVDPDARHKRIEEFRQWKASKDGEKVAEESSDRTVKTAVLPEGEEVQAEEAEAEPAATPDQIAARARLAVIGKLREKNRGLKTQIDTLSRQQDEILRKLSEQDAPQRPETIDSDRDLSYLDQRIRGFEEREEKARGEALSREQYERTREWVEESASESAEIFVASEPRWLEAHGAARQKFAEEIQDSPVNINGVNHRFGDLPEPEKERYLNFVEHKFTYDWLQRGLDPATEIWNYSGYGSPNGRDEQAVQENASAGSAGTSQQDRAGDVQPTSQRVTRIKEGLQQTSISDARGHSTVRNAGRVTLQDLYANYGENERTAILGDEDAFEQIMNGPGAPIEKVKSLIT